MKKVIFYLVLIAGLVIPAAAFGQVLAKKNGTVGLQTALKSALQDQVGASELKQDNVRAGGATFKVYKGLKDGNVVGQVVVVNEEGNVIYTEQVTEIVTEPDYDAVLNALK